MNREEAVKKLVKSGDPDDVLIGKLLSDGVLSMPNKKVKGEENGEVAK